MMKKAKVFLCSLLVLCAVFFCMTALAAEDIVFTFENDASLAGWSTSYLRYNFDPGCFLGMPLKNRQTFPTRCLSARSSISTRRIIVM